MAGDKRDLMKHATREALQHIWPIIIFSTVINLLMLTGSIYMLQVYDRVLSSRSIETLVALSFIVVVAFCLQGFLDSARMRMLSRVGAVFDDTIGPVVQRAAILLPLKGAPASEALQPQRDADTIRGFLSGLGPTALIDLPFLPIFIGGCFFLHAWLGYLAIFGGLVILVIAMWTERTSKGPMYALNKSAGERQIVTEMGRRNAETVRALGMQGSYNVRLAKAHKTHVDDNLSLSDTTAGIGSAARVFRLGLQSAVLGVGAWLVIRGELSGGAMIAASVMTSRALAPVEVAVANWKGFVSSRQGYARLRHILPLLAEPDPALSLPAPRMTLNVTDLVTAPPGSREAFVQGVSISLKAGDGLGIIGPSGSGKSSLARALVGVWPVLRGSIRLDGAETNNWAPDVIGRNVGYLAQDVELFDGTIAENIARLDQNPSSDAVIKAARIAGAHEMILGLPRGYDTRVGEAGAALSGGQRQRVALARAMYGDPFLIVLDEPNANLDHEGDEALARAITACRQRGAIVLVVTHRPTGLAAVDLLAVMSAGRIKHIGPKDDVLRSMTRNPADVPRPRQAPRDVSAELSDGETPAPSTGVGAQIGQAALLETLKKSVQARG
ncbi:MAG: type I secretion system permease/ATPase [Bosea sp. (in: a-proteobacteria)]